MDYEKAYERLYRELSDIKIQVILLRDAASLIFSSAIKMIDEAQIKTEETYLRRDLEVEVIMEKHLGESWIDRIRAALETEKRFKREKKLIREIHRDETAKRGIDRLSRCLSQVETNMKYYPKRQDEETTNEPKK